ncbi:MAG TPA: SDR family NAD(P)-dependent oxidoreductase, partial [Burkholderiaceae bacterium]|nr:SDR family NAD(P)-dependent oxidoreductase [Burkholderiaceae bacterium]
MSGRLAGRVAVVTGGASGIGAATVALMLREGARVVATDVDARGGAASIDALAPELRGAATFMPLDVTDEDAWEATFARVAREVGPPDVVVNNAGVMPEIVTLTRTSLAEWRRVTAVNLDGTFLGVKHAMLAMAGRGGSIVNVSSIAGLVGMPFNGAYGPSKAAVAMLTKGAALEGARSDPPIRVNAVHPGYIRTDMTGAIADVLGAERFGQRVRSVVPLRRMGD